MFSVGRKEVSLAVKDLWEGVWSLHVWPMLGWQEIKQRYRRSTLGPFWLTISTGVMIAGMGPLYSKLLGQEMSAYFSYLAIGFVVWLLMAGLINDACATFISAEGYIKQIKLPLTIHVLRMVWKNLLIFAHNFVIVILVLLFYRPNFDWHLVLLPVGILLIAVNGVWLGILLGLICARFRDIPNIVASLVQVAFFLTPVLWKADMLGRYNWVATWNPLFHFLEIVRRPLLGESPPALSWMAALFVTGAGLAITLAFFSRYRARIAYWV